MLSVAIGSTLKSVTLTPNFPARLPLASNPVPNLSTLLQAM